MENFVDIATKLESTILSQDTYNEAKKQAEIFLDKHSTLHNGFWLQHIAIWTLEIFDKVKCYNALRQCL